MTNKSIDNQVSQEISEIFEEANIVQYNQNIKYVARKKHLEKGQDLVMGPNGDFIAVKDYSSLEDESN